MEAEQSTPARVAREDATTQSQPQVKFTFKGADPTSTAPSDPRDPSAAPASGLSSSSAALNTDQPPTSNGSPSSRSNGSKVAENGHGTQDTAMRDAVIPDGHMDVERDGTGSSEVTPTAKEETEVSKADGSQATSARLEERPARPRTRTEDLAHPPSDSGNPGSPLVSSEAPSRAPSPTPRETTPAPSEAPSDTASVDSSFAGPPPETSAFDLSHPLSSYQFANTTLVPVASTSTNPFHFVSWPPQPLEDSWQRTRLPDDAEANLEFDSEAGYHATPAEIEATRLRQEAKQAKIKARLSQAKGKGKAKEAPVKPPKAARAMDRTASADGSVPVPARRGRPPKSSLQQRIVKEPEPERPRPLVTKTRFPRDLAMALIPDDAQTALPLGIAPHPDFVDLLAMPPHYITEEGVPPKSNVVARQRNTSKSQPTPTPAVSGAATPQDVVTETNGTKRTREETDEGAGGPKKKTKEESLEPDPPAPAPKVEDTANVAEWVMQTTTCLSKKIDGQLRCFQCIARAIGHGCCFLGMRHFGVDATGQIVTGPAFLDTSLADDIPKFTKTHTTALNDQYNQLMRTWLAPQLAPIIARERAHAESAGTRRERLDLSMHSICDTCNASILGSEWMCSTCGRVSCRTCHQMLLDLEEREANNEAVAMTPVEIVRRKKCIARRRATEKVAGETHTSDQFVPMTRLDKADLEQLAADLTKWKITHAIVPSNGSAKKFLDNTYLTESPLPDYDQNTHPVHHIPAADMSAAVFLELWLSTAPVLVTDIDLAGLKKWTPSYIANRFPQLDVQLQNNKGSEVLTAKAPYFFSQFNEDGGPQRSADAKQTFRTKDFPTARQFGREFRDLAEEFYKILPIRDIIHPDGPLNFLAHTPTNAIQPDVGPRGTNSWAVDAATGTTMLRTDVTDVASLMYWGHHDEATGRELRIRWDVYRSEDTKGLRDFCWEILTKKLPRGTSATKFRENHDDPLLSPCIYLNQRQRETLAATKKIYSHAIYQYPGQLVLIPAGCPYQVSSWSDHLSLTTQFLAGPRLGEAIKVNEACRRETKERTLWRTDNIQLERQLLYAWVSLTALPGSTAQPKPPNADLRIVNYPPPQYSCQNADKNYVPTPLDWKPRAGPTAEELARDKAAQ
ncbi:hypothetical protein JCM11491_003904 [Sporobolomyces phaffii]